MSLFDDLVNTALQSSQSMAPLRMVVEKELLHHDILRVLSDAGLLTQLTFIGGTCLRTCYGASRLSEDLDFTGGAGFTKERMTNMGQVLVNSLQVKYGLQVEVSEPVREESNVSTWKVKIQTRPERKDMAAQRIHLDVCAIPSYQPRPMMLLNPYGVDMGTSGLILQAQSRQEIFADKLLAFALRPNKFKNRDLWDMAWLHQQQVKPAVELMPKKLQDHHVLPSQYLTNFKERVGSLTSDPAAVRDFQDEMCRFLPALTVQETVLRQDYWVYLTGLMQDHLDLVARALNAMTLFGQQHRQPGPHLQ